MVANSRWRGSGTSSACRWSVGGTWTTSALIITVVFAGDRHGVGEASGLGEQQSSAADAAPLAISVPAYPALAPPFPQTWQLNRSTIIHTSNKSGWTDTASAARYGIISFDAQNAEALWLTPNRSQCTAEEAMIEQARRVKVASPSTKVLVYRNVMWALQWLSSERAAMEDPTKAHYFLRYPVPTPAPTAAAGNIYYTQAHEGNQYLWNYSNPEAVKYKMEVVVMGEGGVGNQYVDGMFLGKIRASPSPQHTHTRYYADHFAHSTTKACNGVATLFSDDPGPSTAEHPMEEYLVNLQAAAKAVNMTPTQVQTLATDTHNMVVELRRKLQSQGKMLWLNGVDNANPFPLVDNQVLDANCSVEAPFQCGWWHAPVPGDGCVDFFRLRCSNATLGNVALGVLGPWRQDPGTWPVQRGSWELSIATLLLLRQESGWIAPAFWLPTSAATPLPWSHDLDRDVGIPQDDHCTEDMAQAGVFRRMWSGGEASVDCSDLSVVLPGVPP